MDKKIKIGPWMCLFMGLVSCTNFLDEKPNAALSAPHTLEDLQAMLSNSNIFGKEPMLPEVSTTDYYLEEESLQSLADEAHKRAYLWGTQGLFQENLSNDWKTVYDLVYYCNTVLEGLEDIERDEKNAVVYDRVQGEALFFRGKSLLQAALLWVEAYDEELRESKLGLPLRMDTDFNKVSVRSTMGETYDAVISDLKSAAPLLPDYPHHLTRPSKAAAFGALSRTYMAMRKYEDALYYADEALAIRHELLDFNVLDDQLSFPIPEYHEEVVFSSFFQIDQILDHTRLLVSPELFALYSEADRRREILFSVAADGKVTFKGRFAVGGYALFSGIATNELLLNRAECYARMENYEMARADLLRLLDKRYRPGYVPDIADDGLLSVIMEERRKDLPFRGIRWMDIKRLNREGAGIVQQREAAGEQVSLSPNDLRYARPISDFVVDISGMEQNLQE